MQTFSPKASSVLEKKLFKSFNHIWAWRPSWSTNRDHFSNLLFPLTKEAPYEIWAKVAQRLQRRSCLKFWTFFPYKCIRKQNWPLPWKGQMSMYDHYFSNFGSPPIPDDICLDDICKDSAIRHARFGRRRFLKVFPIQMQTWPCRKTVKRQRTTILLAIVVDLPSPMTYAKIQPQGILDSGGEDFYMFLPYMGMAAISVNGPQPFFNFSFPHPKEAPYEIEAKLAHRLQRRSRLKMLTDWCTDVRTDDGRKVITIAHPEQSSG